MSGFLNHWLALHFSKSDFTSMFEVKKRLSMCRMWSDFNGQRKLMALWCFNFAELGHWWFNFITVGRIWCADLSQLVGCPNKPLLSLPRSEYVGKLNCVSLCSRLAIRQSINAYGHTRRVPTYCDRLILKCIIFCIKPPLELSDLLVVVK